MDTHIFKGPLLHRLLHAQPTTRRGRIVPHFQLHRNQPRRWRLSVTEIRDK